MSVHKPLATEPYDYRTTIGSVIDSSHSNVDANIAWDRMTLIHARPVAKRPLEMQYQFAETWYYLSAFALDVSNLFDAQSRM